MNRLRALGEIAVSVIVGGAAGAAVVTALVHLNTGDNAATRDLAAMQRVDGHAATWDKCSLTYRADATHAPRGATGDLSAAMDDLSAATGARFVRATGDADLRISWARPAGNGQAGSAATVLGGDPRVAAITETTADYAPRLWPLPSKHHLTGADIVIRPDASGVGGASGQRAFLLHELAHALGVGHSDDPGSLMYGDGLPPGKYRTVPADDLATIRAFTTHCH